MRMKRTREQIIKAATKLFADEGYENTKIDTIIREAGVSKPTFYAYFESKQALLEYLVQECEAVFVDELTPFMPLNGKIDNLVDAYQERFAQLFRCMEAHKELMIIALEENSNVDQLMSHIADVVIRNIHNETRSKIVSWKYREEIFADILIYNSVMFATRYLFRGKESIEVLSRVMASLLLEQII